MSRTEYKGIDYGMGLTNKDKDNGIRYGVINMNKLAYPDEIEPIYACGCPHCGQEIDPDDLHGIWHSACPHCDKVSTEEEYYSEELIGYKYDQDGILIEGYTNGDLFILKSPIAIRAQFYSPCSPGACHLEYPCDSGELAYALPLDWFDDEHCPYSADDIVTL